MGVQDRDWYKDEYKRQEHGGESSVRAPVFTITLRHIAYGKAVLGGIICGALLAGAHLGYIEPRRLMKVAAVVGLAWLAGAFFRWIRRVNGNPHKWPRR